MSGRRAFLDAYIKIDPDYKIYSYQFAQTTQYIPTWLSVFHSSDVPYGQCFLTRSLLSGDNNEVFSFSVTLSYIVYDSYGNQNDSYGITSRYMSSAWIAFVNNLNPNRPNRTFINLFNLLLC